MSAIASIGAVQARIQQIEQQFALRRPMVASPRPADAAGSSAVAAAVPSASVLGASASGEVSAQQLTGPGTTGTAAGVASALGIDDPALMQQLDGLVATATAGASAAPIAGSFDEAFTVAVQRLRSGWSAATVPGASPVVAGVGVAATSNGADANAAGVGAATVVRGIGVDGAVSPSTPYAAMFEAAGARHGIPPRVLAAVGYVESRFRTDAISSAGAVGMMQFLPTTAASMGVNPSDPASAIDGAARYLRHALDRFGSLEQAIASYNVGPGSIARSGGVQPGSQAERYLTKVLEATGNV